jgi:flagellar biosynthetic protein FliS
MAPSNPYSNDRDTQVKTASPVTLIILLYEGVVKAIMKGETLLREPQEDARFAEAARHLLKAMNIVAELQGILNPDQAPDIANSLSETYKSVLILINAALQDKDPDPLGRAAEIMNTLLVTWREAAEQVAQQAG